MTSASHVTAKPYFNSTSRSDADSFVRTAAAQPRLAPAETDALRTSHAGGSAVHTFSRSEPSAAGVFSRRGVWPRDRRSTRRCDTDFRSAGHIEEELQASAVESALSAQGEAELDQQRTRGGVCCGRARTDAEVLASTSSLYATPTPNQAMQLTPARRTIHSHDSYNLLSAHHARSRQA